jgi:hypothetical protein
MYRLSASRFATRAQVHGLIPDCGAIAVRTESGDRCLDVSVVPRPLGIGCAKDLINPLASFHRQVDLPIPNRSQTEGRDHVDERER